MYDWLLENIPAIENAAGTCHLKKKKYMTVRGVPWYYLAGHGAHLFKL